jgi:hypothetical protein
MGENSMRENSCKLATHAKHLGVELIPKNIAALAR